MIGFVTLDPDGNATGGGLCPPGAELPPGAVAVAAAEYGLRLTQRWDGQAWGPSTRPGPAPEPPEAVALARLEAARRDATRHLLDFVAAVRLRFVTPLPEQGMVYLTKQRQAEAYLAALARAQATPLPLGPMPSLADPAYRFVEADTLRWGISGYEAAQIILNNAWLWTVIADELDRVRGPASDAIATATTPAAAHALAAAALQDMQTVLGALGIL